MIETIPGKNLMALELPNARRQTIRLSEILGSTAYHEGKSLLTMGLGKDIIGQPVVEGAKVQATIKAQHKGDKVIVFNYVPKERIRRKKGHRQLLTRLRIDAIEL